MELILLLIMAVLLFVWVVFVAILFFKKVRKQIIAEGIKAKVKCSACDRIYEVDAKEYARPHMSKRKTFTRTKIKGVALVNEPEYKYYGMKCFCPTCGKKVEAEVLNIKEINDKNRAGLLSAAGKYLVMMMLGGALILSVMSIPLKLEERARMQKIQKIKNQRYEELKKEYNIKGK